MALCLMTGEVSAAKSDPVRDSAYKTIITSFQNRNWEETLFLIDRFESKYPASELESSLLETSAECMVKLRRLNEAEAIATKILVQFPELQLIGRARLVLGECALLTGRWEEAEGQLAWVASFGGDADASRMAKKRLDELHGYLKAQERVDAKPPQQDQPKVALILPMTGVNSDEANGFLKGFLYSWSKTSFPAPYLFDNENDPVKSVHLYSEVVRDYNTLVVVGGILSSDATGMAAYSGQLQVPFLTTCCGDDGLASISPFVIQGRPDYGGLADRLGEYATAEMGLRRLAILYVNNVVGRRMAKDFRESVDENGGEIIAEASYFAGTVDYTSYISQLKNTLVRRNFDDSLNSVYIEKGSLEFEGNIIVPSPTDIIVEDSPSVNGDVNIETVHLSGRILDSLWISSEQRTRKWMVENVQEIDTASIDLTVLDGIFVVIEPGTVEMIAPQLTRYKLDDQIFGNENWGDLEALRKNQRYVDGIIYCDPLFSDNDSLLTEMTNAMIQQGERSVTRFHFAGERAARMVEEAVKHSTLSGGFRDAISTLNEIPTMSGAVTLVKEERVDRSVGLIQFKSGTWKKIYQ